MSIHAAKGALRTVKNYTKGYSDIQAKVRNATSNDPWGPSGTQMNEIAQATYNHHDFIEIMEMLDKRLNDKGKNWRHVFKALTVLDYCLHAGSENVVFYAKDNIYIVKTLREFQYLDDDGKDVGANVRQKAKDITALLLDDERLRTERQSRSNMRDRMTGKYERERPSRTEDTFYNPDRETGYNRPAPLEDDSDLQRAIELSKKSAEEEARRKTQTQKADEELEKALKLSKEEDELRKQKDSEQTQQALFDNSMDQQLFQPYQQQQQVDFFGNPIYGNAPQLTGFGMQATGFGNNFDANAYQQHILQQQQQQQQQQWETHQAELRRQQDLAMQQQQQLQMQQQQQQQLQMQQQQQMQMQQQQQQQLQMQQQLMPMPTGSNNPFGQFAQSQQQPLQPQFTSSISTQPTGFGNIASYATLSNRNTNNDAFLSSSSSMSMPSSISFSSDLFSPSSANTTTPTSPAPKRNAADDKYSALASALASGEGQDTFGNTGNLRIPLGSGFASQQRIALQSTGVQNGNTTGTSSFNPSSAFGVALMTSNTPSSNTSAIPNASTPAFNSSTSSSNAFGTLGTSGSNFNPSTSSSNAFGSLGGPGSTMNTSNSLSFGGMSNGPGFSASSNTLATDSLIDLSNDTPLPLGNVANSNSNNPFAPR